MRIKWKQTEIHTYNGTVNGISPWIISASRATDIPAFYSQWFFERLETGYVKWINPFNRNNHQYISFDSTEVVVFWSKNPEPIIPLLKRLGDRGITYYFQFTLNDYEDEGLEPSLPSLEKRIETFKVLSGTIGKERVIWRFDPLLMTDWIGPEMLLEKMERVGEVIHPFTEKLVFSFADISGYTRVGRNLKKAGIVHREFYNTVMESVAERVAVMCRSWGITVATCAENIDLKRFKIEHNRCIDDELILRITEKNGRSRAFEMFLGYDREGDLFAADTGMVRENSINLKDKGQRKACGCIYSRDIGSYNTCTHGCLYCYANSSPEAALRNRLKISVGNESLLP